METGTLFIAGGATTHHFDRMLKALIEAAGGPQHRFALIVSASGDGPDETFREYQKDFARMGVAPENVVLIPLYDPDVRDERGFNALNGDHPCLPALFEGVRGAWFTGGDQYYTAKCFLRPDGTPTRALELLHEIYRSGGAIGGSSAGAAIMSHVMIGDGTNRAVLGRQTLFNYDQYDEICASDDPINPLIITQGLGFFTQGIVDQHFNYRPRLLRLIEACMLNPEGVRVGFGVSEDTAMVVHGDSVTVLGGAGVYVADCRNAVRTAPGCYDHVLLHAIHEGDSLDLSTGVFTLAGDDSGKSPTYVTPDYVAGGFINSPAFDRFMSVNVLRCREDLMPLDEAHGKRYAQGVDVCDIDGQAHAVVFRYLRDASTRGYRAAHTSFTGIGLQTQARTINL